jgi:anti-sigma factor RsiW
MERDEILRRVTDALCGELDPAGMSELQAALAADPALAAEAGRLEGVWRRLALIPEGEKPERAVLSRVFESIVNREPLELSDEELDQAAGGTSIRDDEDLK